MSRIRTKIFLLALGSLLSAAAFLAGASLRSLRLSLERELELRALALSRSAALYGSTELGRGGREGLEDFLASLSAEPDLAEARFLDTAGRVLAAGSSAGSQAALRPDPELLARARASFVPQTRVSEEGGTRYRSVYQRAWTERSGRIETLGVWQCRFSLYRADREVRRVALGLLGITGAFCALSLCAWYYFAARLARPLEELRAAAEELGRGGLPAALPLAGADEVGVLAREFGRMAVAVRAKEDELEAQVRDRTRGLLQAEKMAAVGQLAAGVAHEINNPLGIILGFAQSAARRVAPGDPLALAIRSIERESLRCRNLVQSLLTFSRRSRARSDEEFRLAEALESALSLVEAQARIRSVEVRREGWPGLWKDEHRLRGDKNALSQAVINLCSNALDAMPGGGVLSVAARCARKDGRAWAEIRVADTGTGIPEAIRGRVFEPFFTTKEPGKGTGLGLALVYEIAQSHGGRVEFVSEEGRGTAFTLTLPAWEPGGDGAAGRGP